ncbi:hypothetical protein RIF29_15977 [Crotalaria pallida]|uniref:Protein UXT homolog n=1 Tax=Crotalaria pallida TaxID=3830 RepID=A0AAN9FI12_CROPI
MVGLWALKWVQPNHFLVQPNFPNHSSFPLPLFLCSSSPVLLLHCPVHTRRRHHHHEDTTTQRRRHLQDLRTEGLMDNVRQEKVQRYEEFVDKRLKPDLHHAIAQRDKVFEQQKTFADLRKNIENLEKNSVTSLRTLVNLGSEVYLQAEVPDTQHIFVDIGLGFHVEFTWSEALNFIEKREEKIARQIEEYTQLIASIKAQIKLVLEGIRELLELPAEKSLPERIF